MAGRRGSRPLDSVVVSLWTLKLTLTNLGRPMAGRRGSRPLDSVALLLLLLLVYPGFISLSLLLAGSSAKIKGMRHETGMGLPYVN
jgi:hypothetical protein